MLQEQVYTVYGELLRGELITAMGCTEPIAIAYAGALARQILGREPDTLQLACSGNIVKNVKGVTVPNSGGKLRKSWHRKAGDRRPAGRLRGRCHPPSGGAGKRH